MPQSSPSEWIRCALHVIMQAESYCWDLPIHWIVVSCESCGFAVFSLACSALATAHKQFWFSGLVRAFAEGSICDCERLSWQLKDIGCPMYPDVQHVLFRPLFDSGTYYYLILPALIDSFVSLVVSGCTTCSVSLLVAARSDALRCQVYVIVVH